MAKKPAPPNLTVVPDVDASALAGDDALEQRIRDEELFYAEMGQAPDDAVAHVYLVQPDGSEPKIWRGPPSSLDLESLGKKFGSGNYRVMLYARGPSGMLARRMNKVIPQLLTPEDDARIRATREGRGADGNAAPALTADAIAQAVRAALPPAPVVATPPIDPLAMMRTLGEIMRTMTPPAPVAAAPTPALDFMTVLTAAKSLNELARGIAPNPDDAADTDPGTRMFNRAANTVMDLIAKGGAAAPAPQPTPNPAPLPAPAHAAPAPNADEDEAMMMFRLQIKMAVRAALRQEPAAEFAEGIYPLLPDADLHAFATDATWFDKLCTLVPECAPHRVWFDAVRAQLVKMATEDGVLTPPAVSGSVPPNSSGDDVGATGSTGPTN